ncbi:hypothetical protein HDU67_007270 [Dinochytrium kinnereticum]|nr:hypothetical protein HDU67_007270 [Dinochytrium kinnereticum]
MILDLDLEHLDVGRRRRSHLLRNSISEASSSSKTFEEEVEAAASLIIGSSAYALRKFQSHVRFVMGSMTLFEAGRAQDLMDRERLERRALGHFRKALNGGPGESVLAVAVLAFFSEFGMGGVENDFREAERLYTDAANQGCGFAQARLAFLKTHGRPNIKINHAEAEKWRTACRSNSTSKRSSPSTTSSTSTPEDEIPASIRWLRLAAEARVPAAQFCLALCHYNGIAVPSNDREAFKWCELAAQQGHPGAQNVLGNLYIEGSGCAVNPSAGLRWYIRAAEKKEAAAIYNIGTLFERGLAVEEDPTQAFEWYVRASVFGSVNAQNVLGIFHEQGIGVHQNPARAVYYYRTAALSGHPHAQYNLGRCYHDGFGVQADDTLAVSWFKLGAEQGHALSLLSMAVCSEAGIGVPADKDRAFGFYRRAAMRDSFEAKRRLGPAVALGVLVPARALLCMPLKCRDVAVEEIGRGLSVSPSLVSPPTLTVERFCSYRRASSVVSPCSSSVNFYGLFAPTPSVPMLSSSTRRRASSFASAVNAAPLSPPSTPKRPMVTIADLPVEILIHILSYLDDLRILSRAQLRTIIHHAADKKTLPLLRSPSSCQPLDVQENAEETSRAGSRSEPVSPVDFVVGAERGGLGHLDLAASDFDVFRAMEEVLAEDGEVKERERAKGAAREVTEGRDGLLRKFGLPVFRRACACIGGGCTKIKHYVSVLEDSSEIEPL